MQLQIGSGYCRRILTTTNIKNNYNIEILKKLFSILDKNLYVGKSTNFFLTLKNRIDYLEKNAIKCYNNV